MVDQVLSDVKVVDLTWYIAGPFCTKLLADFGADVIKIEKPGEGDPARKMGPFPKDEPHPEKGGLFLHLNTNKKGITLNLKSEAGKGIFRELVRDADILVENFSPGVMERLGIGFDQIKKINPKIVMTSISNFGQTGPYRNFKSSDLITFAMGGCMNANGTPDQEPVSIYRNVKMMECSYLAATATLGAWHGARRYGTAEHIDMSLMEAQMGSTDRRDCHLTTYAYTGFITPRKDPTKTRLFVLPVGFYPAKDGWVQAAFMPQDLPKLLAALGKPEMVQDPRFQNPFNVEAAPDMDAIFLEWISDLGKQEACEYMQSRGLALTPINTPEDLLNLEHFHERKFWIDIEHPVAGTFTFPGPIARFAEGGYKVRMPAPLLGQHNAQIYGALGYNGEAQVKLSAMGII